MATSHPSFLVGSFVEDVGALSTAATLYAAATPAQISDLQFGILVVQREREVVFRLQKGWNRHTIRQGSSHYNSAFD